MTGSVAYPTRAREWWTSARTTAARVPFVRHVGLAMSANLIIAALGLATGLLTARLLGPDDRGELAAIQTWPTFLATFAMLGLDSAVVYWTSRDREQSASYLATALALIGIAAIPVSALGWALMPVLLHAQTAAVIGAARVFLLMIPIYAFIGLPHQVLRSVGAWRAWNAVRLAPGISWIAALVFVAYARPAWLTPVKLSEAFLLCHLWLILPLWQLVRREIKGPLRAELALCRPMLHFGLPDMLTVLPRTLNLRLDQLLMAAFLDRRTLGLYVVAVSWSSAASPLLSAIGPVLFPTLSAAADRRQQLAWLKRVLRVTVAAAVTLTVVVLAVTPMLVPLLFGPAFRQAVQPALVLVLAGGVNAVNLVLADGLRGLGRTRTIFLSECVGLLVTAVMLWALLRPFGATGAAMTSLAAYLTVSVVLVIAVRRTSDS